MAPLVVHTVRRAPWGTVLGCVVVAVAVTWLVASREAATTGQVITALRWSAVVLAAAVASVLDDPTEDDLAGAGLPVWVRRTTALGVVGLPAAIGWVGAMATTDLGLPRGAVSLEATALVLLGVAVASTRRARGASIPAGVVAAVPPTGLLVVGVLLPDRWALLVDPADGAVWRQAHLRWAVLAAAAMVVVALLARDPARRSPLRLLRPARRRHPAATPTPGTHETLVEPT